MDNTSELSSILELKINKLVADRFCMFSELQEGWDINSGERLNENSVKGLLQLLEYIDFKNIDVAIFTYA